MICCTSKSWWRFSPYHGSNKTWGGLRPLPQFWAASLWSYVTGSLLAWTCEPSRANPATVMRPEKNSHLLQLHFDLICWRTHRQVAMLQSKTKMEKHMKQKPTFYRWLASLKKWVGKNFCNPKVLKTVLLVFRLLITALKFIERIKSGVLWFFYNRPSPCFSFNER